MFPFCSGPDRGTYRDRHGRWVGMRWTRPADRRAAGCGRWNRVVLAPRCWR